MYKEVRTELTRSGEVWRSIAENRRLLAKINRGGKPEGPMQQFTDDLKVELSVLGHQVLLVVMIAAANIIFFGLLIFALPYLFRWLF